MGTIEITKSIRLSQAAIKTNEYNYKVLINSGDPLQSNSSDFPYPLAVVCCLNTTDERSIKCDIDPSSASDTRAISIYTDKPVEGGYMWYLELTNMLGEDIGYIEVYVTSGTRTKTKAKTMVEKPMGS